MCPTLTFYKKSKNFSPKNHNNLEIHKIYNSRPWKKLRLFYLMNHPLCKKCLEVGLIVVGVEVDHIKEISSGINIDEKLALALDENNLQTLCLACHHKKHNNKKQ